MKTLISYAHTGQKLEDLRAPLSSIRDSLKESGVEAYCTFFNQDEFDGHSLSAREIMDHAFRTIDDADFLFVVQLSEARSEGMLMEVGYCIAKDIPVIVAIKDGIQGTYLPDMATAKICWRDPDDLRSQLRSFDFSSLSL